LQQKDVSSTNAAFPANILENSAAKEEFHFKFFVNHWGVHEQSHSSQLTALPFESIIIMKREASLGLPINNQRPTAVQIATAPYVQYKKIIAVS
jgi:hypothetical protein